MKTETHRVDLFILILGEYGSFLTCHVFRERLCNRLN